MKTFTLFCIAFILTACKFESEEDFSFVESPHINIPNTSINSITKQALYDKLYEIYIIQKEAITETIREELLAHSKEDAYMPFDSIINKYKIKINIKEPNPPSIQIQNQYIVWDNNILSTPTNTIIEIIDPECEICCIASHKIKELYINRGKDVALGYVVYSMENSLSAQALLYASYMQKFIELNNDFLSTHPLDTITILQIMNKHSLDTKDFLQKIPSIRNEITTRNLYLRNLGINKLPTILVNNKLIYNPLDTISINKKLNEHK